MKSITLTLDEFRNSYYLAWTVASRCYNTMNVKIIADRKEYFNANKTNHIVGLEKSG